MASARRVSVGFQGGQTLSLRLAEGALSSLRKAVEKGGWHELEAEDGVVVLDLDRVVYVRTESDDHHVGFSAA